jgi:CheY-like chemotaxis protein
VHYEATSLRNAVELAGKLRAKSFGHVHIRPATRRLLNGPWTVVFTPLRVPGDPVRVLVVDDSAPFRRAAAGLLRRRGYVVVGQVGSAAAARYAVEREAPDAILMDVALGDGCGIELAAGLIRARPGLAVLLVSANDPPGQARRVAASGAKGFVQKSCLAAIPLERFFGAPSP